MAMHKNIIIIMNEDHGQWALGSYGNREIKSPTLDFLAKTGVQMNNAFTPIPVCSPSRACLLTGRYPSQHGVHDYISSSIPTCHEREWLKNEITLSEVLNEHGYQTGMCGKWHLGNDDHRQAGFDHWFTNSGHYPIEHGGTHIYSDNGHLVTLSGYKTQIITDNAISFLRGIDKTRPFFLFISYTSSHSPWNNHPERLVEQYRDCPFISIPDDVTYPFGTQKLESLSVDRSLQKEAQAQYYASVTQIDEAVGRVIDELEASNLRESTLLVFTSDHGLNCGHHGIWGKGNGTFPLNMVEESIRIPLIFNHPKNIKGLQQRIEFVDHCDTFQTLVEYVGIDLPFPQDNYPGTSYLALLNDSKPINDWRTYQIGEYGNVRMIRTFTHKLTLRYPNGPNELINILDDSREIRNLYNEPSQKDLIKDLSSHIDTFFSKYEEPDTSGLLREKLPLHNNTEAWR